MAWWIAYCYCWYKASVSAVRSCCALILDAECKSNRNCCPALHRFCSFHTCIPTASTSAGERWHFGFAFCLMNLHLSSMDKYQASSLWYLHYQRLGLFCHVFLHWFRVSLGNGMSAKQVCICFNVLAELTYVRGSAYFNHSHDVVSSVPLLIGEPCFYTCSLDVMRQVLGNEIKAGLVKPQDMTMEP